MDDAREQIQPVLNPGEVVLWSGRSDRSVLFTAADGYLIPFSLFFSGFSIFWIVVASTSENASPDNPFPLFGLPFLILGLYYLLGRFLVKSILKRMTAYAITNRRVIVLVGRSRLHEAALTGGSRVTRFSRDRSHMSVTFNSAIQPTAWMSGWGRGSQLVPNTGLDPFDFAGRFPVAFYDVADVDGLQSALARISAAAPPSTQNSPTS